MAKDKKGKEQLMQLRITVQQHKQIIQLGHGKYGESFKQVLQRILDKAKM